jgi:hypothetical protein
MLLDDADRNSDKTSARLICLVHGKVRYCREHRRAEFPPDAARRWFKKNCRTTLNDCELVYRAGFMPMGRGIA